MKKKDIREIILSREDELKSLINNPSISLKDIAKYLNIDGKNASEDIRLILVELGYKSKTQQYNEKIDEISKDLYNLYIIQNKPKRILLQELNITSWLFEKALRKLKIKKPKYLEQQNRNKTCFDRYGVENISQVKIVDDKKHKESLIRNIDVDEFGKYYEKYGTSETSLKYNISSDYIYKMRKYFNIYKKTTRLNTPQKEIRTFLEKNNIKYIINDRKLLKGKELDFILTDYNIAIEYDGIFWHNDQIIDKNYHLNKTKACKNNNIQLLHIFENEYVNNPDLVKSMILAKCKIFDSRIYARKCEIKELDNNTYNEFITMNHIQGYCSAKIRYGLFYNNELVQCMSFSKARYSKYEYELIRLATKINTQIIGGASKLFKYFINNIECNSLVSYANLRYSDNAFYESIGLKYNHSTNPNYFYFHTSNPLKLYTRDKFQKHKLKNIKGFKYDENLSEYENMKNNKYCRIWDCGNNVYVWKKGD